MNLPPPPPDGPDGDAREPADPNGDIAESHGVDAYRQGHPLKANPYQDPFYREAWENGWKDAELEAKALVPEEVIPEPRVVRRTTPRESPSLAPSLDFGW